MQLDVLDTISVYSANGGWKTSITKKIRDRLQATSRQPFKVVVYGISGIDGLVLLVNENRLPRKKDFLEKAIGVSVTASGLAISISKEDAKRMVEKPQEE